MTAGVVTPDFSSVNLKKKNENHKEMLSISGEKIRINSSSLNLIQTCPRKAFYSLHEGYKSKAVSMPLVFGSAVHKAMEVFYSYSGKERELPADFESNVELMSQGDVPQEKHFIYDALFAFMKAGDELRLLPDTDKRSIASGLWMLSHYFQNYLHDKYVIYRDEHGPFTERSFSINLTETIELFGQIDFVFKDEVTGLLLPGDHKTSSRLGSEFFNRTKPNHQFTGYLYAAREAFGIDTEFFLINGLMVKSRPLTARGSPPSFTRQITRRTKEDFEEFKDVVREAVGNYLRWMDWNRWPLGPVDACANYGGCQYLDVCSQSPEIRQNILDAHFEKEALCQV